MAPLPMATDDWATTTTTDDWAQQQQPTERTFKHDLQGFAFHLLMVGLIGTTVAVGLNLGVIPQPVVRVQVQAVQ